MPKKAFKKKKAHQAHCREMVKQGYINDEVGNWKSPSHLNTVHRRMFEDHKAGYKL